MDKNVKNCVVCWEDNHIDNFTCVNCGFDFDLIGEINVMFDELHDNHFTGKDNR